MIQYKMIISTKTRNNITFMIVLLAQFGMTLESNLTVLNARVGAW